MSPRPLRAGRAAPTFNNPYSLPLRGQITNYFASGTRTRYGGMSAALGEEVTYIHRTLADFLDAFLAAGWRVARLVDVPAAPHIDQPLPAGSRFPFFTALAFDKPK